MTRRKKQTTAKLKKIAWQLLSKIVRLTYADNGYVNCFTCSSGGLVNEMQAGHAIGGRHNAVLLDEEILRPQCVGCNIFKRGNYQVFITKLIEENGFEWWQQKLENSRKLVYFTRGELEVTIERYRERLADLEANAVCAVFDALDEGKL